MNKLTLSALFAVVFAVGCSSNGHKPIQTARLTDAEAKLAGVTNETVTARIDTVDVGEKLHFSERFKPQGFGLGSWVNRADGVAFQPLPTQGRNVAVVYLYRPNTEWNRQEIIAPSIFLNGNRLASLRNNHYYYLELPAGIYNLAVRRPLGFVYFQKGHRVDMKVEAGESYYIRYDEQKLLRLPDPSLELLKAGPLAQIPYDQAIKEISSTRLLTPGYTFVPPADTLAKSTLPARFTEKQPKAVSKDRLTLNKEPEVEMVFKLWNPLTW